MQKFIAIILVLLTIQTYGQINLSKEIHTTVGTPYERLEGDRKEYYYDGDGNVFTIVTDGQKVTIQRYSIGTMKETGRKVYQDFPGRIRVQQVTNLDNRLFYIYSIFNKEEGKEYVYLRQINLKDGLFESPTLLFSTSAEAAVSSDSDGNGDLTGMFSLGTPVRFELDKSGDLTKVLLRYRLKPKERDDSKSRDVIGFYVFNSGFQKLWGGEVEMPHTEKEMNNLAYAVSNEGKAFVLTRKNDPKQFELLVVTSDLKATSNKIEMDSEMALQHYALRQTVDGNFACIGYYINNKLPIITDFGPGLGMNLDGLLYFKMDQNGKTIGKSVLEYPIDLINQYESEKDIKTNAAWQADDMAGIHDLKVTDIVLAEDGSTLVTGEQQYALDDGPASNGGRLHKYLFLDIIAVKLNNRGEMVWQKKIPKEQIGVNGKGIMSMQYAHVKGANYFFYVDSNENINPENKGVPEKYKDGKEGYLMVARIDDLTGLMEKYIVCSTIAINGTKIQDFEPYRIIETGDNTFLLEAETKGKESTMIKIEWTR